MRGLVGGAQTRKPDGLSRDPGTAPVCRGTSGKRLTHVLRVSASATFTRRREDFPPQAVVRFGWGRCPRSGAGPGRRRVAVVTREMLSEGGGVGQSREKRRRSPPAGGRVPCTRRPLSRAGADVPTYVAPGAGGSDPAWAPSLQRQWPRCQDAVGGSFVPRDRRGRRGASGRRGGARPQSQAGDVTSEGRHGLCPLPAFRSGLQEEKGRPRTAGTQPAAPPGWPLCPSPPTGGGRAPASPPQPFLWAHEDRGPACPPACEPALHTAWTQQDVALFASQGSHASLSFSVSVWRTSLSSEWHGQHPPLTQGAARTARPRTRF